MGYIQGYIATITVNGTSYHPDASSASLSLTKNAMDKTKLGTDRRTYLAGLGDATLDMQLHLNTATAVALNTAYNSDVPVAYEFRPGATGTTDAGQYDGNLIVTDYSQDGDAEGEWDVSLTGQGTGPITFTAPV